MFKNKHVIVALIVAPILAILAWFATGMIVDEKPHSMQEGGVYTLNVKSNCRWPSGNCTLVNEDVEINITGEYTSYTLELAMKSTVMLSDIKIAFNKNDKPQSLIYDKDKDMWGGILDLKNKSKFINTVIIVNDTVFYAQVPTTFLEPNDGINSYEKN